MLCEHDGILCEVKISGGGVQYKTICKKCGYSMTEAIAHDLLTDTEKQNAYKTTSERLQVARDAFLSTKYARPSEGQTAAWRTWYFNEYLHSDEWYAKRDARLERDKYVCQGCIKPIPNQATQVHHSTYDRVDIGDAHELMIDLISLCNDCHERIHGRKINNNY